MRDAGERLGDLGLRRADRPIAGPGRSGSPDGRRARTARPRCRGPCRYRCLRRYRCPCRNPRRCPNRHRRRRRRRRRSRCPCPRRRWSVRPSPSVFRCCMRTTTARPDGSRTSIASRASPLYSANVAMHRRGCRWQRKARTIRPEPRCPSSRSATRGCESA